jgi:hypothetical protein
MPPGIAKGGLYLIVNRRLSAGSPTQEPVVQKKRSDERQREWVIRE